MAVTFRLLAYDRTGTTRVSALPEPMGWDATVGHSTLDVSLTVTYDRDAAAGTVVASAITDGLQYAVEAWDAAAGEWIEPDGARFKATGREWDLVEMFGADGSAETVPVVRLQCSPVAWETSKVQSLNTSVLLPDEADNAGKRPFLSATPGIIVGTLLEEYEARHTGASWPRTFTSMTDTAGDPWAGVLTIYYDHQARLDVILENLVNQGACEFTTRGPELVLVNPPAGSGTVKTGPLAPDLTGTVALTLGTMVEQAPSEEWVTDLANHYSFHGGEGLHVSQSFPEVPVVGSYGPWEASYSSESVTDPGTAAAFLQATAAANGRVRGQYVQDLAPVLPADAPVPLVDYAPGAWVLGHGAAGLEPMRLQQVVIRDDGQSDQTVSLVLNDVLLEDDLRRAKRQLGIVGGSTGTGGSNVRPAPEGPDTRVPSTPTGLVLSSDWYIDSKGDPQGVLSGAVGEVTTATDSSVLEIDHYEWAIRPNTLGHPWSFLDATDEPEFASSPYPPGSEYAVRVRAHGRFTTTPSEWSDQQAIVVADDTTPPGQLSKPGASSRLGVVTVTWDGQMDGGGLPPADFAHVEAAMSESTAGPWVPVGYAITQAGSIHITGVPDGAIRRFKIRAVDRSGNALDWTAVTQVSDEVTAEGVVLELGAVKAIHLDSEALFGKLIVGADIRSSSTPWAAGTGGWHATANAFRMWDSTGARRVDFTPGDDLFEIRGVFEATNATGQGVSIHPPSTTLGGRVYFDDNNPWNPYIASGHPSEVATARASLTMVSGLTAADGRRARLRLEPGGDIWLGAVPTGTASEERVFLNMRTAGFGTQLRNNEPNGFVTVGTSGVSGVSLVASDLTQFRVRGDQVEARGIFDVTTTAQANVVVFSDGPGRMARSTSLSAYKLDQAPLPATAADAVYDLTPVTWTDRWEQEHGMTNGRRYLGFIAEDVAAVEATHGLEGLTVEDHEGNLQSVAYDRLVALTIPALRDLRDRIEALEAAQ